MNKKAIGQVVLEFISVVFAVLLALGLNSYKADQDLKNEADLLKEKILIECKKNSLELDTAFKKNIKQKQYLDSLANLDEFTSDFDVSFSSELLTKSAWDFTKSSRSFSYLDEEFLNEAAAIYERQDYYMEISKQMFQNLGDLLLTDPEPTKTISISIYYIMNLNASAENLTNNYTRFLDTFHPDNQNVKP